MIPTQRIASIDITRALTMLLMIFVNDLWSLQNIPAWLEHTAAEEDGMGLADAVFPAFLFIVGMSIPYAISNRIKKGDNTLQLLRHVTERSIALLVMGLFLVNGEYLNQAATGMTRGVWNIICCTSFIFIWNQYPAKWPKSAQYIMKGTGIAVLLLMAWICRGGDGAQRFSTYWWGILGLIGWAYFAGALIYVLGRGKFSAVFIGWIVFSGLSMATHAQLLPRGTFLSTLLGPLDNGAMPSLVMGGTLVSLIFRSYMAAGKWRAVIPLLLGVAVVLATAGLLTRPIWEISKIRATPSWVMICTALTIGLFVITYWLGDLQQKAHWFKIIKPAGTDTLLCYLIPYFAYAILTMTGVFAMEALSGWVGILKSLLFAILMIQVAGLLNKAGIRLKL